jgi:hypothetical protein
MWWFVIFVGVGLVAAMLVALARRGDVGNVRRSDLPANRRMDHSGSDPDTAPGGGLGGMGG